MPQTEQTGPRGGGEVIHEVLGDHPRTRIVFTLISQARRGENHDLNPSDLARMAGLERTTVYNHLEELVETGVIEESRTVGNSTMYRINKESEAAKALAQFDDARVMGRE